MKKIITPIIVIFVIFIGVLVAGPFYIINEGEQAVIIQMGRLVRVVTDAGLYIKIPVIEEVVRYPKRIIAWDGESNIMPTRERQFIFVDVTARWRISDPQVFYEAISSISAAHSKLGEIIDSEVRTVVAENYIHESIRNSNLLLYREESADALGLGDIDAEIISTIQLESEDHAPIEKGRRQLAEEILARSKRMVPQYGIELIDVVTRQIRYSDDLTQSVYARMIKERNQIAQYYRSLGEGRKASWFGRLENEKRSILSAAYTQAETIRGRADAEASQIYADAYNRDRGFFEFWRATESYRTTLPKFEKTLSTDMDYFRYLYSPR
ncbi:MAG: protease modulator HflC [Treponema sp.]|nr:protease modulator HflC [Treponema sp.]